MEKPNKRIKLPFEEKSDYFDELENLILAKTTGKGFHLSPGIKHPYKAPEGYFDMVDHTIISKTVGLNTQKTSVFSKVWKNYAGVIRMAAMFILLSAAGLYLYQNQTNSISSETQIAELETDAIIDYLEDESLTINDLALAVENTDIISNPDLIPAEKLNEEDLLQLIDLQYSSDI
jgi:hypothetical protein